MGDNNTATDVAWVEDDPVVRVILGTLFFSRQTVRDAVKHCKSPEFAVYAWSNLIFSAAEQGEEKSKTFNLAASVQMPLSKTQTSGMEALKKVGAIKVEMLSGSGKTVLQDGDTKFEAFWSQYPRRNGLRQGKAAAKKVFDKIVLSDDDYAAILEALVNYKKSCGEFPKDAERFLKNWSDYV